MKTRLFTLSFAAIGLTTISSAQPSDASSIEKAKTSLLSTGAFETITSIKVTNKETKKVFVEDSYRWDYIVNMKIEGTQKLKASGAVVRVSDQGGALYTMNGSNYTFRTGFHSGNSNILDPLPEPNKEKYQAILTDAFIKGISKSPNDYPFVSLNFKSCNDPIKYGNTGLYSEKSYQWTHRDEVFRSMYFFDYVILCKEENPKDQWDEYRPTYSYYETSISGKDGFYLKWNEKTESYEVDGSIPLRCESTIPTPTGESIYTKVDRLKITKDEYELKMSQTLGRSDAESSNAQSAYSKPSIPASFKTNFSSPIDMASSIYKLLVTTDDGAGIENFLTVYLGDFYKSKGYQLNDKGIELVSQIKKGISEGAYKKQYCEEYTVYQRGNEMNYQNLYSAKGYGAVWCTILCAQSSDGFYIKSISAPLVSQTNQQINCDGTKFNGQTGTNTITNSNGTNSNVNTNNNETTEADEFQVGDKVLVEFSGGKKYDGVITRGKDKWNKTYKVEVNGKIYDTHPEFISKP